MARLQEHSSNEGAAHYSVVDLDPEDLGFPSNRFRALVRKLGRRSVVDPLTFDTFAEVVKERFGGRQGDRDDIRGCEASS